MNMRKTFLFDLYGTLIDLHTNEVKPTLWRALARIYSMYGAAYTGPELYKEYKRLRPLEIERLLPVMQARYNAPDLTIDQIEVDLDEVFKQFFLNKGVTPTSEQIEFVSISFRAISMKYIKLFDGVIELLDELHKRGCKAYLLSNAQASFTHPEVVSLGLADKLDGLFYSSDAGVLKPSYYFYNALIEEFNLDKSDCVMVGNEYKADVMGAHDFGIPSIFVHTEHSCGAIGTLPDDCTRITDIRDVIKCL